MHFCSFVSLCYADFCTFFGVLFLLFYCFDRYALNIFVLAPRFECCPRAHFNWIFYFAQWKQKLNMRAQRSAKSVIIPLPSPISHFPSHINFDSSLPLNLWFSLSLSLCPVPVLSPGMLLLAQMHNAAGEKGEKTNWKVSVPRVYHFGYFRWVLTWTYIRKLNVLPGIFWESIPNWFAIDFEWYPMAPSGWVPAVVASSSGLCWRFMQIKLRCDFNEIWAGVQRRKMQFIEGQIEKAIQQFQPDILIFACIIRLFEDLFEIQLCYAYLNCILMVKII